MCHSRPLFAVTRRCITVLCLGLFTACAGSATATAAESLAGTRPNVMVILCDDLGYGDLACYGNKTIKTPHLDKLAGQGMRLTDCYSAAPVCSSSRVGLLTGRTPNRAGVYDWIPSNNAMHLRAGEVTVAKLLREAGYDTAHVGKWHCNGKFNQPEQPQPGDHGFNHWFSTQNNASPTHHNPKNFVRNGEAVGELEGYSCQIVADEAIQWLREGRDKGKPFFAFVCFHEPHEPIDSPPDMVAQYPQATKKGEALYYANVQNMDAAVGKLMAALDELKLADDTLVFFTSDNGPETLNRYANAWRSHGSPGPLRGMKLHIYDGGIRVAGILRWPRRLAPGQTSAVPVGGVDVLPTLCELAGVKLPAARPLDGSSIVPLLEGRPIERHQPLHWHYYNAISRPKVAMRDGEWKIVAHIDNLGQRSGQRFTQEDIDRLKATELVNFELYHISEDIGEQNDLAATEPQRLEAMSKRLKEIYADVQAEIFPWQ